MIALRLLDGGMDKRSLSVLPACCSMSVQSVGGVKPALSPIEGRDASNRQPPVSPFFKGDLMESHFAKGELNRKSGRLCRTCRFLGLFFFLIMPSVFLADTSDAAWGTSTVDSANDTGQYTSIAVGTSGAAYISYYDLTRTALMYATNVSGSWVATTVDNTSSANTGPYTSIAVGTSGAAYISYNDNTNGDLMYATNVSGSWGTTTVDGAGGVNTGEYTSIAVGSSGAAYISYYDVTNTALMYATNVGGTWGTTTVDNTSSANTGKYTSIAVGTSGAVYISYQDVTNTALMYATNVGGTWGTTTVDNTGNTGEVNSIAVGTSGAAYISYYSSSDLMYATNVSGSWGTTTVDSTNNTGYYTSIAVGTSGAAYISYYDITIGDLKYATNVSGSWGTSTLDSANNVGEYTSIEVGTSGAVYISYRDNTNGDLKYAANPTHTAVTGAASGVSTAGATLGGTANATGLPTTAYFQYGVTSGSYTGTSSTQSVSGTSDTAVSIALSGLSAGTTYYYRLANQHYTNLVYGSEASFSTSSAPVSEPTPIPVTLTVTSTNPANSAADVAATTTVSATFSMFVNGSTVTTDTFTLSDGSSLVSGAVSTNGATVTFTPSLSLAHSTTYTGTLTTGIKAANYAGTQMTSNYSWSFTTIAATPTPTATPIVIPTATPTQTPTESPTPTATPVGTVTTALDLSKYEAYLNGDTIVARVVDADRGTNASTADILTTALKAAGTTYFSGDLLLDMVENDVNSGTFLATIKTGTTTSGGASANTRSNIGTIKTVQGGTATVIYTDTAPNASTITKTVFFISFDATLAFNADTYSLGSYAVISHVDAEENEDATKVDTLLNHAVIETSSINRAWLRLIETGADTGTFKGSILVSSTATLDNESIQASNGDTLTVGCPDEINTSGAPLWVTAVSRVVSSESTPTPATTPTPTPSASPTPSLCEAESITVSPRKLTLNRNKSGDVTVPVTGSDDCAVEGETVTATTNKAGEKRISLPASDTTDENGEVVFTITAKDKTGNARVTFTAGDAKPKRITVKVKK